VKCSTIVFRLAPLDATSFAGGRGDGFRPMDHAFAGLYKHIRAVVPFDAPSYRAPSRKVPRCVGKPAANPAHHRVQGPVVEDELITCKAGHLLTPDNVVVENRNGRPFKRCRICRREAWKDWQRQNSTPAGGAKAPPGKTSK
jgi:hypothetical protein